MQRHIMVEYDFKDDEVEETLSLSNLVNHDAAWDDYSSTDMPPPSNLSSIEQNCFEFFSDEWSAKITTLPDQGHQNIIFCGKVIQSKNPTFTKTKESDYSSLSKNVEYARMDKRSDLLVDGKMLGLASRKPRWYMLFLGVAPRMKPSGGGMQLREVRHRQCRPIGGGQRSDEYMKKSKGGLWGLVKALGCGEYNHATAVKESIKSISKCDM